MGKLIKTYDMQLAECNSDSLSSFFLKMSFFHLFHLSMYTHTKKSTLVLAVFFCPSSSSPSLGPWTLRVLHSICAVPVTALLWTDISVVAPGICWCHSPSFGVAVLSAPVTTRTTVTLTLYIFSSTFLALDISQASHSS